MSSLRFRRLAAVLGLAGWIALAPVAANAAAEPFHLLQIEGGLLAQAWDFVAGLLGIASTADSATVGTTPTTDGAPSLDTDDSGEIGATVDPNGRT